MEQSCNIYSTFERHRILHKIMDKRSPSMISPQKQVTRPKPSSPLKALLAKIRQNDSVKSSVVPRTRCPVMVNWWARFLSKKKDHDLSPLGLAFYLSRLQPDSLLSTKQSRSFKVDHQSVHQSENLPMWSDVLPTNIGLVTACPLENQM